MKLGPAGTGAMLGLGSARLLGILVALVTLFGGGQPRALFASCAGPRCRLYLPLVGGRHRLDLGDYGLEGPRWRHLGQTDRIWDMAYDGRGHLWAATEGGLVEWPPDGAPPIRHSLAAIRQVAVDSAGGVWFGGEQGAAGEDLHRRLPDGSVNVIGKAHGLPGGTLADLVADESGQVFAGWRAGGNGGGGLSRVDASGTVRTWRKADGLKQTDVTRLAVDGASGVWFDQADADGLPVPGLGLLSAGGRLRPDVAMPAAIKDLPVVGLAAGGGGAILVIVQQQAELARTSSAAKGAADGLGVTVLFERDAKGTWTAIELPGAIVEARRRSPLGFEPGPRQVGSDDRGDLWIVLDQVLVRMQGNGGLSFLPESPEPGGEWGLPAAEMAERLTDDTILAQRPGGGVALASNSRRGWYQLGGMDSPAAAATLALRTDPRALPVPPSGLVLDGAGTAYLSGSGSVWRRRTGVEAWEPADGRTPQVGLGSERDPREQLGPVLVGPDGVYWIGDGRSLLRVAADRRQRNGVRPKDGLTGGFILCLGLGADGTLWVGTSDGVAHLDAAGRWLKPDLGPAPSRRVEDIASAPNGDVWLALSTDFSAGRPGGLLRLREGAPAAYWSPQQLYGVDSFTTGQLAVAVADDGEVWSSSIIGLTHGNGERGWAAVESPSGPSGMLGDLAFDARGDLWVASLSDGGVYRYERAKDRWRHVFGRDSIHGLVAQIVVDRARGDVWFALEERFDEGPMLLRRDARGDWRPLSMAGVNGSIFEPPVRNLALAPDGTVVQTVREDRILLHGPSGEGVWMPQDRLPFDFGDLARCATPDGRLWILGRLGLAGFGGQVWQITQSADGLPQGRPVTLACGADGSLWLATQSIGAREGGLAPAEGGVSRRLPDGSWQDLGAEAVMGGERVAALAATAAGTLAVASSLRVDPSRPLEGGSLLLRWPDGRWRRIPFAAFGDPGLRVRSMLFDPGGLLYLATDRGAFGWPPSTTSLRVPGAIQREGLPSLDVRGLAWARGRLWAATASGVAELMPDWRWRPYDRVDGLSENALREVAAGPNGEVWFLTEQGGISILEP